MSDSTKSTPLPQSNVWKKKHDYNEPLVENIKIRVGDVEANFAVLSRAQPGKNGLDCLVSVTTEEAVDYEIDCSLTTPTRDDKPKWLFKVTSAKPTAIPFRWQKVVGHDPMLLELAFKDMKYQQLYPLPRAGLKLYIERGPTVLLVGSDGNVTVPLRALEIRSEAFESMFKHDCQEKKTGRIEMKDFDCKTLDAFSYFLSAGRIRDGEGTALGLILLADKYDIQDLKEAAENFVKKNFEKMNQEEVLDVFGKVGRKSLKQALTVAWTEKGQESK